MFDREKRGAMLACSDFELSTTMQLVTARDTSFDIIPEYLWQHNKKDKQEQEIHHQWDLAEHLGHLTQDLLNSQDPISIVMPNPDPTIRLVANAKQHTCTRTCRERVTKPEQIPTASLEAIQFMEQHGFSALAHMD